MLASAVAVRCWGVPVSGVNLPNSMTLSRIACVPLLIWLLSASSPLHGHGQEWAVSLLFIAASVTDGLDGYLARKRGQITTMGMLLDPLADKLMVTSAYIALVAFDPAVVKPWIAVVVIGREFLVSGLRSIAANEGFTIDASEIGKLKTVLQIVSVVACVFDRGYNEWVFGPGSNLLGRHWIRVVRDPRARHCRGGDLLDDAGVDSERGGLLCGVLEQGEPGGR